MNFDDLLLMAQANGDRNRIDPNEYTFNFYKIDSKGNLSGHNTLSVTITDFTYNGSSILFPEMQYVTIKGMTSCSFKYLKSVGHYSLYQFAYNSKSTISGAVEFPALANIGRYGLYQAFSFCNKITSASFRKLKAVDADYSMQYAFSECKSLKEVSFPSLTEIGSYGLNYAFYACTNLAEVSFPSLTTVNSGGLSSVFRGCSSLTKVSFPKLTEVGGKNSMQDTFNGCTRLTEVSFPSLTTVSSKSCMDGVFRNCSSSLKVHFKESMSGNPYLTYSNLGLSSSSQIVFDLP